MFNSIPDLYLLNANSNNPLSDVIIEMSPDTATQLLANRKAKLPHLITIALNDQFTALYPCTLPILLPPP